MKTHGIHNYIYLTLKTRKQAEEIMQFYYNYPINGYRIGFRWRHASLHLLN